MTDPNHRTVKLRNGTEEFYPLVAVLTLTLRKLVSCDDYKVGDPLPPVVIYELVAKARDRNHTVFTGIGEPLKALALFDTEEGAMHDSTRNIVLSSFEGELDDLKLVNPLHDSEQAQVSDDDVSIETT